MDRNKAMTVALAALDSSGMARKVVVKMSGLTDEPPRGLADSVGAVIGRQVEIEWIKRSGNEIKTGNGVITEGDRGYGRGRRMGD